MPARGASKGVGGEELQKLISKGYGSPTVLARLQWATAEGFRRYVASIASKQRVYPDFLPTQATGRWSVTNPPLANFPDDAKAAKRKLPALRRCFVPDPGTYWLCWDWEALHARFMAMASNDTKDIAAFRSEWDIHTLTACDVFRWPYPPQPWTKALHINEEALAWRTEHEWLGGGDRRRHLMKTLRYALLNAYDEKGVMESKDVEELGLTMSELLAHARAYLRAKPNLVAFKKAFCEDAMSKGVARSAILGRRRVIRGGDYKTKFKLAISGWLQGTEVDILELTLQEILGQPQSGLPGGIYREEARLAYTAHDGVKLVFPERIPVEEAYVTVKRIVEQERQIGQHSLPFPAEWSVVRPGGSHEKP